MSTLKTIYTIYKPFLRPTTVVMLLLVFSIGAGFAVPYFFGKIVSAVTANSPSEEIWTLVFGALVASLSALFISYMRERFEARNLDWDIPHYFQYVTLNKANELSVNQHMNENSGKLQSIVNTGESAARQLVKVIFYDVLPTFIRVSIAVILCLLLDIYVALVLLVSVILLFIIMFWFQGHFRSELRSHEEMRHERNTLHAELLRNFVFIKLFGSSNKVISTYKKIGDEFVLIGKALWTRMMDYHLIQGSFIHIIRIATMVIALIGVFYGRYDVGGFVILFTWVQSATGQLESIYGIQKQLIEVLPRVEKYMEFLNTKSDIIFGSYVPKHINGTIEFKNVEFVYRNKTYLSLEESDEHEREIKALKNLSFSIKAGQTVALVGPSGAGKSTIVQMLLGAYLPEKGDVLIDDISLASYDIDSLRQFIGYVPQQIDPFDDTIRANIELGLPADRKASEDEIQKAVHIAALQDVIIRAPKGLETKIGEKGIKLSGGERQRLGIARALIRDPRILIFDEATSNLDTKNERLITEAVNRIAKDRTTIIIAHRLATVAHADKIIYVKDGKVAAEGTHKELLTSSPDYRELVEHQLVLD